MMPGVKGKKFVKIGRYTHEFETGQNINPRMIEKAKEDLLLQIKKDYPLGATKEKLLNYLERLEAWGLLPSKSRSPGEKKPVERIREELEATGKSETLEKTYRSIQAFMRQQPEERVTLDDRLLLEILKDEVKEAMPITHEETMREIKYLKEERKLSGFGNKKLEELTAKEIEYIYKKLKGQ